VLVLLLCFKLLLCLIVSIIIVLVFQFKSNQLWFRGDGITTIGVVGLNAMNIYIIVLIMPYLFWLS